MCNCVYRIDPFSILSSEERRLLSIRHRWQFALMLFVGLSGIERSAFNDCDQRKGSSFSAGFCLLTADQFNQLERAVAVLS